MPKDNWTGDPNNDNTEWSCGESYEFCVTVQAITNKFATFRNSKFQCPQSERETAAWARSNRQDLVPIRWRSGYFQRVCLENRELLS